MEVRTAARDSRAAQSEFTGNVSVDGEGCRDVGFEFNGFGSV